MSQALKTVELLTKVTKAVAKTANLESQAHNLKRLLSSNDKFRLLREGRKVKGVKQSGTISITFDMSPEARLLFQNRLIEVERELEVAKQVSDTFLGNPQVKALLDMMGGIDALQTDDDADDEDFDADGEGDDDDADNE